MLSRMGMLCTALVVTLLHCQVEEQGPQQKSLPSYWVKQLELPAKQGLAMERLVAMGPRAVERLVGCLEDPRPEIRLRAVRALGFIGKDSRPALTKLNALKASKDRNMTLAVESAIDAIQGGRGILLVGDFSDGKLFELDGRGKARVVLDDVPSFRSNQLLASGNYLVSTEDRVCEMTAKGTTVWSVTDAKPNDAVRLANGNTLIASGERHEVTEVNAAGKVVWRFADESREFRPVSCRRLRNGNTLIADYPVEDLRAGRVIEVDKDKQVVWELAWKLPATAHRLSGDRTLIVSHKPGRVQIVDRLGKVLQVWEDVDIPTEAEYLPNGHLLVGGESYLRELDAKGKRLWNKSMSWVGSIQRL